MTVAPRWFEGLLRTAGIRHQRVTFSELFFDLVYGFAVTQLVVALLAHRTGEGALNTSILLFAVWWSWIGTVWVTNWLDPDRKAIRLALFGLMFLSLAMAALLPYAFDRHGLGFALLFTGGSISRYVVLALACGEDRALRLNFTRISIWVSFSAVIWITGGAIGGTTQQVLWLVALAIDLGGPLLGFPTPGLGRSTTADWPVSGGYFAERFQLFVLIVLGESIADTGGAFAALDIGWRQFLGLLIAFAGSASIWWIYFDRAADRVMNALEGSTDPGQLARSALTYWHLPIVAGIMLSAAGDQLTITQPRGDTTLSIALIALGGPALFLAGMTALHRLVLAERRPDILIGIALLLLGVPLAFLTPPLVAGLYSTAVLIVAAARGSRALSLPRATHA